jgi:hypothetical protein
VRVLVSPMSFASVDEWRRAIHDVLRVLLEADQAITFLPNAGEFVLSHDLDESALRTLRTWMSGFTPDGRLNTTDPVVNEWNDRRRELGLNIYTRRIINHAIGGRVLKSPFVNEALIPNSMRYWQGAYAKGPGNTDALLWASHAKEGKAPDDETAEALLGIVAPAFQAGLSSLYRLEGARGAIDAAEVPMLVFDTDGRRLHASEAFTAQMSGSDEAAVLSRGRELARKVAAGLIAKSTSGAPPHVSAEMRTPSASYLLRATLLRDGGFGSDAAVAIVITRAGRVSLPSAASLVAGMGSRNAKPKWHCSSLRGHRAMQ